MLCEPSSEVFFAEYLRRMGVCVSGAQTLCGSELVPVRAHHTHLLCLKGDEHFTELSARVPVGFMDWNIQKVSHQSHATPGGRRGAEGESGCWWRGAKPHLHLSAGGDETMCTYITPFQRDKCWGDPVRARVTVILFDSGEHQAKSLSGFLTQFPLL